MADLESALHYSLRVELAAHDDIKGDALNALNKYVSVLAKVEHASSAHKHSEVKYEKVLVYVHPSIYSSITFFLFG